MVATKMDQFECLGAHDEGREAGRPLDENDECGHFSTAFAEISKNCLGF